MPLNAKEKILADLLALPDHNDKFKYLIQKGKELPPMPEELKIDKYRIEGCLSKLWLQASSKEGKLYFYSDSDAAIPKGIAAILLAIYNECSPEEALAFDPSFLREAGIEQHLSMNRSNGIAKLCNQIRMYALAYKTIAERQKPS